MVAKDNNRASWNGIDLVTLKLLLAACEEGNLAKAAARENIALSSLSKRITLLEDRFGVELLHRHDRGVRPTEAMNHILANVQSMFVLLDHIAGDLRATSRGEMGLVRVQAHMTAMSENLAACVAAFLSRHPNIDIELDEATSVAIAHSVRVGVCDIGMVSGTVDVSGLERIIWGYDRLVAVLPIDHPLAAQDSLSFSELTAYPFVAMQRDSALRALFQQEAVAAGEVLNERMHVNSFGVAKKMVGNGLGVSIIPVSAVDAGDDQLIVRPMRDAWTTRELVLCIRRGQRLSQPAALFLDFLRNWPGGVAKAIATR